MESMMTEPMETPIGVIGLRAGALGLRNLELPRRDPDAPPIVASGEYDAAAAAHLATAREQLGEYFDGRRTDFGVPLDWTGVSGLRLRVLKILADVPFGATTTYGALAAAAGEPSASQAVGGIMGSIYAGWATPTEADHRALPSSPGRRRPRRLRRRNPHQGVAAGLGGRAPAGAGLGSVRPI